MKSIRINLALAMIAIALMTAQSVAAETRNAYFGELHIHSSWSIDAYVFGTKQLDPEDATKYAMGESVTHPGGFEVKLPKPLNFTVVMDHSEYTGALAMADDPESPMRKNSPLMANLLRFGTWADGLDLYKLLSVSIVKDVPIDALQGPDVAGHAWNAIAEIAEKYNKPGEFTTFPGWEWTSTPNYKNLHRIVFFKDAKRVPTSEFSSIDSTSPEALWKWMDGERDAGHDVIAVTHNGNLSNGALYPRSIDYAGKPVDRAHAENRMRNEPVAEINQVKGQSETTPFLSPEDEFSDFNVFVWLLLGAEGVPTQYGSYMRLALRDGIAMQGALGFNPYKFGMVAGSDSHSAVSAYRHDNYFGEHSKIDDTIEKRLSSKKLLNMDNREVGTAGLTGVWANENTRDALWDAVWRKETFATSGLHMKVRLFGGWDFDPAIMKQADWVKRGYAQGVPMGGDLPPRAARSTKGAPSFLVWAESDPSGANLDRVQVVKGWARNGQSFEKIYDVAWPDHPVARKPDPVSGKLPAIKSTVDLSKGSYTNTTGSKQLSTVWTDPDFDPADDAFYYVRALLIPTPRWTTIQAAQLGVVPPSVVPLTVQDRAWSSPIWYTPDATARKSAKPGVTLAELERQGAVVLDDEALKATVVGKTARIHNVVTGQHVEILYGTDGKRLVTSIDGKTPEPASLPMLDPQIGYEIRDGRLVTTIGGTAFEVVVYKLGNRYVAARGDEYGYANYEVTF